MCVVAAAADFFFFFFFLGGGGLLIFLTKRLYYKNEFLPNYVNCNRLKFSSVSVKVSST